MAFPWEPHLSLLLDFNLQKSRIKSSFRLPSKPINRSTASLSLQTTTTPKNNQLRKMAPKRKDGESSKPASGAASKKAAADPVSAHSGEEEPNAKKTKFAKPDPGMTAKEFEESAENITLSIGDDGKFGTVTAEPTTFTTGSYGWKASHKIQVKVNVNGEEKEVQVQVGINMTVSGSKPDVKKPTNGKRGRPRKNPVSATED
ncbi:hypothetical protein PSHT_02600 [Puccinia striiformis]|uniref:Uncharacterized protein n=1 Tax=Puccinia striiformis TaxID=27350 RepID=A0A2S4WHP5_9BASI|nr:hypothetical protein PSHT_02600 [Puccinia striiformis]